MFEVIMSTFMDLAVIDLHPDIEPGPVLAALGKAATQQENIDLRVWNHSLPDGRSRLLMCMERSAAHSLIKGAFASVSKHIARILVEVNSDEFGAEQVVLANRDGRLVRTHHLAVEPRTPDGVSYSFIDFVTDPPPHMPPEVLAEIPDEVRADPVAVLNYPELHRMLKTHLGTYDDFPMDEGLICESDHPDALLDGPLARARTAELYGVAVVDLSARVYAFFEAIPAFADWWAALGIERFRGAPDAILGQTAR
ncbi:hypothetical protein [Actinomadura rudentiformis]|uniref:Uncharacterized protein n=1 Tax=Actinomadura rudentiformis TaxID=359158 RepID=A0A6H9YRS6_9ACTN|nr:hypothetical protein [Actinomadura rudentiformis]KAB2347981.1 hypothetical protein F8566_19080 [Actinomadura rudentiformis]